MRFHVLKLAGALALLSPMYSHAATTTSAFAASYYVTGSGVSSNSALGRFEYVGGNGLASSTNLPSFAVYQVNGASLLSSLQSASGVAGGTVTSISSLGLNLSDENNYGGTTPAAGSLAFYYASYSTTPLSEASVPYATPAYDGTQVGGLSTQFGNTDPLGTATYTPTAGNTITTYPLTGSTGYADIASAIDSGSNFYLIVTAGTATTSADFGGYSGLFGPQGQTFLAPSNLSVSATVSAVPEPASLGLIGTAGLMLLGRRRRREASV